MDGYRAIAVRSGGVVTLFSRRKKSLGRKFPYIVEALAGLPDGTVVDGELVALDDRGRPEFSLLQNFRGAASRIHYYIFDLLCCEGRDLTRLPLVERRALLKSLVNVRDQRIRIADYIEAGVSLVSNTRRSVTIPRLVANGRTITHRNGARNKIEYTNGSIGINIVEGGDKNGDLQARQNLVDGLQRKRTAIPAIAKNDRLARSTKTREAANC